MESADAERPHRQALDALCRQHSLQLRQLAAVDDAPREQQEDRARTEPSQRERKRARRGRVEPLNVVDGEHHRPPLGEQVQHVAHRHSESAVIERIVCSLVAEERGLECPSSR
jgi:hypothetical protein